MVRKVRAFVATALLLVFLVACQSAEQRLEGTSEKLPIPSDTAVLASETYERQGSEDACFFTTLTQLYGTNLSYEEVKDFYTAELTDNEWVQESSSGLSEMSLAFRHGGDYALAISDVTSNEYIVKQFKSVKDDQLKSYLTLYTVTLNYADWIAQRFCPE